MKARTPSNGEIKLLNAARVLGVSRTNAYRLFKAGHLKGRQPSPRVLFIYLASAIALREKTRDPEFWETLRDAGY